MGTAGAWARSAGHVATEPTRSPQPAPVPPPQPQPRGAPIPPGPTSRRETTAPGPRPRWCAACPRRTGGLAGPGRVAAGHLEPGPLGQRRCPQRLSTNSGRRPMPVWTPPPERWPRHHQLHHPPCRLWLAGAGESRTGQSGTLTQAACRACPWGRGPWLGPWLLVKGRRPWLWRGPWRGPWLLVRGLRAQMGYAAVGRRTCHVRGGPGAHRHQHDHQQQHQQHQQRGPP